jgi:hypothetical protein
MRSYLLIIQHSYDGMEKIPFNATVPLNHVSLCREGFVFLPCNN